MHTETNCEEDRAHEIEARYVDAAILSHIIIYYIYY